MVCGVLCPQLGGFVPRGVWGRKAYCPIDISAESATECRKHIDKENQVVDFTRCSTSVSSQGRSSLATRSLMRISEPHIHVHTEHAPRSRNKE